MVIGGSALPTALARAAIARGIDIFAGYGMSETCPILTVAHVKTGPSDRRSGTTRPNMRADAGSPFRWSICASSIPT